MKKINTTMWSVIVVVVALISFWGGTKYGAPSAMVSQNGFSRTVGQGGRGGRMPNGGFISGAIVSKDDKSITIKAQDGSSRFIFFSDTTKIMKSTDGTLTDLVVGKDVIANGTPNSDGSITAQSIQLRTTMPRPATPAGN